MSNKLRYTLDGKNWILESNKRILESNKRILESNKRILESNKRILESNKRIHKVNKLKINSNLKNNKIIKKPKNKSLWILDKNQNYTLDLPDIVFNKPSSQETEIKNKLINSEYYITKKSNSKIFINKKCYICKKDDYKDCLRLDISNYNSNKKYIFYHYFCNNKK